MTCDFCKEEFSHKPYVIYRNIATSPCNKNITKITFNFCSRTCMIAEKIMAVTIIKMRTLQELSSDNDFYNEVRTEVIRVSGCTTEEYTKALEKYNSFVELNNFTRLIWKNTYKISIFLICFAVHVCPMSLLRKVVRT